LNTYLTETTRLWPRKEMFTAYYEHLVTSSDLFQIVLQGL